MKAKIVTLRSSNITGKTEFLGADVCLIPESMEDQIVLEAFKEHQDNIKLLLAPHSCKKS